MGTMEFVSALVASLAWPGACVFLLLIFRKQARSILDAAAARIPHVTKLSGPANLAAEFSEKVGLVFSDVNESLDQKIQSGGTRSAGYGHQEGERQIPENAGDRSANESSPVEEIPTGEEEREVPFDAHSKRSELQTTDLAEEEMEFLATMVALAELSPQAAITESWRRVENSMRRHFRYAGLNPDARNFSSQLEGLRRSRPELSDIVLRLRNLRNQAVHLEDKTITEAAAAKYASTALEVSRELERNERS